MLILLLRQCVKSTLNDQKTDSKFEASVTAKLENENSSRKKETKYLKTTMRQ